METAATKPAFRAAFKSRRCLIPADGWYEWQAAGRVKQPFHIRRQDRAPFAFAGLIHNPADAVRFLGCPFTRDRTRARIVWK